LKACNQKSFRLNFGPERRVWFNGRMWASQA